MVYSKGVGWLPNASHAVIRGVAAATTLCRSSHWRSNTFLSYHQSPILGSIPLRARRALQLAYSLICGLEQRASDIKARRGGGANGFVITSQVDDRAACAVVDGRTRSVDNTESVVETVVGEVRQSIGEGVTAECICRVVDAQLREQRRCEVGL